MKIKKVDDKPMVIHTKKKAKIHMHEPKKAKIKGSNIYTVQRGPKIASAKINDTGKKKSYRKSTIHQAEKKEKEPSKFKRNIRESNTSIKTKNTNLHIAGRTGALATGAVTEQVEGGQEVSQAAYLAYEASRPVTGTASRGASLFRKKAAAEAKRRIKKVETGKKLAKKMGKKAASDTAKKVAGDTTKTAAKETAKNTAKETAKTTTKAAKISGSDLVPKLCEKAAEKGYTIFIIGGKDGIAEQAKRKLEKQLSGIKIVGTYAPPYGFEKDKNELDKINQMISDVHPDLLIGCFGCPKQEKWIYENYKKYDATVSVCAGATVDFLAGNIRRAPGWMSDHGLEWFYRFTQEPKRMFKRYFVDDIKIVSLMWKYRK